jgi:hypothetical protein
VGGIENFIEDGFRTPLEMDDFAAPVFGRATALNPAVLLQTVEQSGQGWSLDAHSLGDLFLSEFVSAQRKLHQRAPFALAQPEGAEALIELGAPGSRGGEKHET